MNAAVPSVKRRWIWRLFWRVLRWCGRWISVFLIAPVVIFVSVWPPYNNTPPIRSDGEGYHIWTYAILKGDLSFSWFEGDPNGGVSLHQPEPGVRRYTCKYPPGVALIRLPVMVFVTDPEANGPPFSDGEHAVCIIFGAVALMLVVILGLATCFRLGVSAVWANATIILLTFGAGLFHHGTYDAGFSHIFSALLVAALVWLAARASSSRRLPVTPVAVLVAGLLLVRLTNALLIGFWGMGCVLLSWGAVARRSPGFQFRASLGIALGSLVGFAVTLAVNHAMFGRITLHTYPGEEFTWDHSNVLLVLYGEKFGVFRLYPVLALPIIAGLLTRRSLGITLGFVGVLAAYTMLYGHWWTWHLTCGFGHRGFVDLVPFAVPVLGVALAGLNRFLSGFLVLVGGGATIYTVVQMIMYWSNEEFIPLDIF